MKRIEIASYYCNNIISKDVFICKRRKRRFTVVYAPGNGIFFFFLISMFFRFAGRLWNRRYVRNVRIGYRIILKEIAFFRPILYRDVDYDECSTSSTFRARRYILFHCYTNPVRVNRKIIRRVLLFLTAPQRPQTDRPRKSAGVVDTADQRVGGAADQRVGGAAGKIFRGRFSLSLNRGYYFRRLN